MPKPSIRTTIVLPPKLYDQIEIARGKQTFTAWLILAIEAQLGAHVEKAGDGNQKRQQNEF